MSINAFIRLTQFHSQEELRAKHVLRALDTENPAFYLRVASQAERVRFERFTVSIQLATWPERS